jgi:transposase
MKISRAVHTRIVALSKKGLSTREIAKRVGCARESVRVHLKRRARSKPSAPRSAKEYRETVVPLSWGSVTTQSPFSEVRSITISGVKARRGRNPFKGTFKAITMDDLFIQIRRDERERIKAKVLEAIK